MRTQDEIVNRINYRKDNDFLGFETEEYIPFLDYEHAKSFLKDDVTKEVWETDGVPRTDAKKCMVDYMPFAWEKANNFRGISAARSLQHFIAWLWLDGDDKLWPTLDDYEFYGKPQLVEICKYLQIEPIWDDGVRLNSEPS